MSTNGRHAMSTDPAVIEADIARQREELAQTVDALSAKLDVRARAGDKVAELKDSVTTESGKPRPVLVLAAGATVVAVIALAWWRRRD